MLCGCFCFPRFVSTLWAASVLEGQKLVYLPPVLKPDSLLKMGGPFGDPAICWTNTIDMLYVSGMLDSHFLPLTE